MNAILSKPILDAMAFSVATFPCDATRGKHPNSPFAPYKPVAAQEAESRPGRWTFPELHQNVAQFPELVTAFGERAFSAYWP